MYAYEIEDWTEKKIRRKQWTENRYIILKKNRWHWGNDENQE